MAVNAKVPTFAWRMNVSAANQAVGEIYIYDDIMEEPDWWDDSGVTPTRFKEELDALGQVSRINVYINSNGGDVFAGQAIHSQLARHKAEVWVYVDGLAASIASVVAMAGDKVIMPSNSQMMIHNPWTLFFEIAAANAEYFRQKAKEMQDWAVKMDAIRESLIAAYMKRFKGTREELIALLDAESWLPADRCKKLGFCDEIEGAKQVAASLRGDTLVVNGKTFDLSRFHNRPANVEVVAETESVATATVEEVVVPLSEMAEGVRGAVEAAVRNAGRVLSKENEDHIRNAYDALGKVLDKLNKEGDDEDDEHMMDPDEEHEEMEDNKEHHTKDAALIEVVAELKSLKEELVAMKAAFSMPPTPHKQTTSENDEVVLDLSDDKSGGTPAPDSARELTIELVDEPATEATIEVETLKASIREAVDEQMREFRMRTTGRVD